MKKLILPLILTNMLAGVGSAVMLIVSAGNPIWLGTLITTLPLPFLLIVLTNLLGIARTSPRLPIIQLLSLSGLALVAYLFATKGGDHATAEYVSLGLAIYGAAFVQWFIWIFSSYGRKESAAIVKGRTLPELPLRRLDGSETSSFAFKGSRTLIVFFRANWCPFCMNQLKEVIAKAERLKQAGTQVKFISNQGIGLSKQLAEKLDLPNGYEILQDDDLRAARILGIADIGGTPAGMPAYPDDTVMATVIALDSDGKVLFGDETDNYRVRPHPDTFLHVFER